MKKGKWLIILVAVIAVIIGITSCGGDEEEKGYEIPDVFGIEYTDAVKVLEGDGFKVTAMETSVEDISKKLLYPLESVKKGTVFKIDDYILDGDGNINKNYDFEVGDEAKLLSDDKSVVIYYAKEDYTYVAPVVEEDEKEQEEASKPTSSKEEKTSSTEADDGLSAEFKSAMDSYESFMDEYVGFMKKYYANPTDTSLLSDYADYMSEYADFVEDFGKWEDEDMNDEELAYYIDVQARVNKKLLEVVG